MLFWNVLLSSLLLPNLQDNTDLDRLVWRSERVCGANCVYLMLKLRGLPADYDQIQSVLLSDNLTNLRQMQTYLSEHGLKLTPLKCKPSELTNLALPAIAHTESSWVDAQSNSGHFVVLTSCEDDQVSYIDGTTVEMVKMSRKEFCSTWTGIVAVETPRFYRNSVLLSAFAGTIVGAGLALIYYGFRKRRSSILRYLIILLALTQTRLTSDCAAQTIGETDTIRQSHSRALSKIENICFSARTKTVAYVSEEELFKLTGSICGLNGYEQVLYCKDSRFSIYRVLPWPIIADDVFEMSNGQPFNKVKQTALERWANVSNDVGMQQNLGERILFDGKDVLISDSQDALTSGGKERSLTTRSSPQTINPSKIPETLLDYLFLGVSFISSETAVISRKNTLSSFEEFRISAPEETVNDIRCVKTEAENGRVWFAKDFDYMVAAREWDHHGSIAYRVEFGNPMSLQGTLWVPQTMKTIQYGHKEFHRPELVGKPLYGSSTQVIAYKINQPKDEIAKLLKSVTLVGSWVIDETITNSQSNNPISYVVPASQDDLDLTIAKAKHVNSRSPFPVLVSKRFDSGRLAAFLVSALIAMGFVLYLWRLRYNPLTGNSRSSQ